MIPGLLFNDFEGLNGMIRCYFKEVNTLRERREVVFFNIGSLPNNFAYQI